MGPKRWDWRDLKTNKKMPTRAKKKKINFKMPSACPGDYWWQLSAVQLELGARGKTGSALLASQEPSPYLRACF